MDCTLFDNMEHTRPSVNCAKEWLDDSCSFLLKQTHNGEDLIWSGLFWWVLFWSSKGVLPTYGFDHLVLDAVNTHFLVLEAILAS